MLLCKRWTWCGVYVLLLLCCENQVWGQPYRKIHVPKKPRQLPWSSSEKSISDTRTTNLQAEIQYLLHSGTQMFQRNENEAALKEFHKAIKLQPSNSDAYANVGLCLMRLGEETKAIDAFEQSRKYNPKQTLAILKQAQLLENANRMEEARPLFEKLIEVEPSNPWPHFHLGTYMEMLSQKSRANYHYTRCATLFREKLESPDQAYTPVAGKGFFNELMGQCLVKLRRFEEAEKAFDAALENGYSYAYISKADCYGSQGRMMDAATMYEKAMETDRPTIALLVALGGVYFSIAKPFVTPHSNSREHGLTESIKNEYLLKSVATFDKALKLDPRHGHAMWSKGKALLASQRYKDADELFHLGADFGLWPNRWQHLAPDLLAGVQRYDPTIKSRPNWTSDPVVATAVEILQSNFNIILKELKNSLPDYNLNLQGMSDTVWSNKNSADLVDEGDWMMLYMRKAHGRGDGCSMMPKTCALVEKLEQNGHLGISRHKADDAIAEIGESHTVFLSGLRGNTHVTAHCGPHNRRMRILFPLIIPHNGNYSMRLTDEFLNYEPGKPIVFDDSYEHEVWATAPPDSDEPRVLLILDVVHPSLR
jgi:tetratricopeptide (TPR) repeat protein